MKFQYISYHYYIIAHSSDLKIIILFLTEFATDFSSFRIDPKPDKYLFNASDLPLSVRQDKAPGLEIKNEDEKDIKNLFNLNQKLNFRSPTSKKGLKHLLSIFDKHSSRL